MKKTFRLFVLIVFATILFFSCGKDNSSGPQITGYWKGGFFIERDFFSYEWNLEQDGEEITGTFQFSDGSGFTSVLSSSRIGGDDVTINQQPGGIYLEFDGTANKDRGSMSGRVYVTYRGYTLPSETWTAHKVSDGKSAEKSASGKTSAQKLWEILQK